MDVRRIQRRVASGGLGDPAAESLRRLRILCAALTVIVILRTIVDTTVTGVRRDLGLHVAVAVTAILMLSIVLVVTRSERVSVARRLDVGFAYQIFLSLAVSLARHAEPWTTEDVHRGISPIAAIIILFAALIPTKPSRTLVVSFIAASMEPVALAITVARGNPVPHPNTLVGILFSPLAGAVMATLISRVVYGLSTSVQQAREMGSYRLTDKLGEGGMGEVWRAEHRMLARPAAIKLIRPDAAMDSTAVRRFEREAQTTALLRSPHTVQLYDFGVADDGTFYYVMELLEGLDLEQAVTRYGPMPPRRVANLLQQICLSLDEAHHRGLVHRDIKPANIHIGRIGREYDVVKVLDFGLVKPTMQKVDAYAATVTMDGTFAGTPAFIAPEMVLGERETDARADLYAVGCVGYWLLTGELVFETNSGVKMVLDHVHTPPKPPSARAKQPIPPALDRLILDCLEKDPDHRPASAAALAERLAQLELPEEWSRDVAEAWWRQVA